MCIVTHRVSKASLLSLKRAEVHGKQPEVELKQHKAQTQMLYVNLLNTLRCSKMMFRSSFSPTDNHYSTTLSVCFKTQEQKQSWVTDIQWQACSQCNIDSLRQLLEALCLALSSTFEKLSFPVQVCFCKMYCKAVSWRVFVPLLFFPCNSG